MCIKYKMSTGFAIHVLHIEYGKILNCFLNNGEDIRYDMKTFFIQFGFEYRIN